VLRAKIKTRRAVALAGLALTAALAVSACSSSGSATSGAAGPTATSSADAAALQNPNLDLGSSLNNKPAPDFTLQDQFGRPVSLSQFRGHVTVLSFEDAECTDVCPLTTQSMVLAKELLGPAGTSVRLLGVDANPMANKVADVMAYSQAHGMVNQWDYLTGTDAQLKKVWTAYDIEVQVADGDVTHTPALYVIDAQGRLQKIYLTQMAYSSVTQSAAVIAAEVAGLLPGHPKVKALGSLAALPGQTPADSVTLPEVPASGSASAKSVTLGPGQARLVVFFTTWLTETSDLKAELASLSSYAKFAAGKKLPALTAVDETVTEPSVSAVSAYLSHAGPLGYPVVMDKTGQLADGYGVQDQPWLVLANAAGQVTWQHDGWVSRSALEKAATAHE
jgi:cytochrome oxidase Cu insertion factor (SCO1/SenC/PrrC family)